MSNNQLSTDNGSGFQPNRGLLITGVVLVGVGGALGAAGVLLGTTAIVSAGRQWVRQLDRPPAEIAKLRWQQLKSAGVAGAKAWQEQNS